MAPLLSNMRAYSETGVAPISEEKLYAEYVDLQRIIADFRKTNDVAAMKYKLAQLENSRQMLESNQRTAAALQETIGKNGRAAADAAVRRANTLTAAQTAIATKRAEFDSRTFNSAAAKYSASNRDAAGAQDAAAELFNMMTLQGVKYNQANPNTASLADQYTVMVGLGPLSEIAKTPGGIENAVARIGGSDALQTQMRAFLSAAVQGESETRLASQAIQKGTERLQQLASLAYANPDAPPPKEVRDEILSLNEKLSADFLSYARESMPEVQAQLEATSATNSEYQRLLDREARLTRRLDAADPTTKRRTEASLGRIVAQPVFQEWAKSNGLAIGTAVVDENGEVTYAPGKDDFKALMRFQYQMQNPNRFGERLFFDRGGSTGTVVEVTYTDPAERERQLARLAYDNGNLVGIESDGKMRYLTRQQYEDANENNGAEPTGYQSAVGSDGNAYLKDPYGNVYQAGADEEGNFKTTLVTSPPPGLQFSDAVITVGGKPARYMTAADFGSSSTKLDSIDDTSTTGVSEELAKVSPFKRVPPDQAREIGSVTTIGTLDKMHANTIIKNGVGALSINGGQQVITPAMKPYVREIVRKDGAKLSDVGGVVRQVRAEQLAATYGANDPRSLAEQRAIAGAYYGEAPDQGRLTTAPLGTTATTEIAMSNVAPSPVTSPNALERAAAAGGPQAQAMADNLVRAGTGTYEGVAAAAQERTAAPSVLAPSTTAPAAPSAAVTPASAPAPVAAGAAAAAPAAYLRSKDGYIFKVTGPAQGRTLEVVAGPKGSPIPSNPVFKPGDPRIAKLNMQGAELVDYDPAKGTVTPKVSTTAPAASAAAPAPAAPAAPAPAAPPAPSKVEGRGEGVELEVRRGVVTEPTERVRPTLASTIVGGFREALRRDVEDREEPDLLDALKELKARREAKRQVETAAPLAAAAPTTPSTSPVPLVPLRPGVREAGEAAVAKAQEEGFRRAALKEKYGETAPQPAPSLDLKPQPGADSITGLMTSALAQPKGASTPAPAASPTAAPTPVPKLGTQVSLPSSQLLGGKSMAEQMRAEERGIGKPTQEPAAPKGTPVQPPETKAASMGPLNRYRAYAAVSTGTKAEGEIPTAPAPTSPRAASTPSAAKLDTSMAAQPSREAQIREARLREVEARRKEIQDALAAAKQTPARATVPELNAPAAIRTK